MCQHALLRWAKWFHNTVDVAFPHGCRDHGSRLSFNIAVSEFRGCRSSWDEQLLSIAATDANLVIQASCSLFLPYGSYFDIVLTPFVPSSASFLLNLCNILLHVPSADEAPALPRWRYRIDLLSHRLSGWRQAHRRSRSRLSTTLQASPR